MDDRPFMLRMFASNSLYHGLRLENLERTNRFLKAQKIEPFSVDEVQTEMNEEQKRQTTLHRAVIARRINGLTEYRKGDGWTTGRKDAEVFELNEVGIGDRYCKIYDEDPNNRELLWVEPEADPSEEERRRVRGYLDVLSKSDAKKRR